MRESIIAILKLENDSVDLWVNERLFQILMRLQDGKFCKADVNGARERKLWALFSPDNCGKISIIDFGALQ